MDRDEVLAEIKSCEQLAIKFPQSRQEIKQHCLDLIERRRKRQLSDIEAEANYLVSTVFKAFEEPDA